MENKIALYRKYRPTNFDEVYGQKPIVKSLESAIVNQEINHSYIFSGNKGSGKTTLAKIFSKAINCLNLKDKYNPCNECENCLAINKNATTDFVELDAASNSGVNEIRNIIETVKYLPNQLKYKVYIIDEAHMLSTSSWNALLKTVEEPPSYVVFIFATTEYHKIPATIISRCQRFDFNKITNNDLMSLLKNVTKQEKIKITNQALETICNMSDGAARDALSILDQLVNYDHNEINDQTIANLFGTLTIKTKIDFLNLLIDNNEQNIIDLINKYDDSGINFELLSKDVLDILMDKLIYLRTKNTNLLTILTDKDIDKINLNNEQQILNLIDIFMQALSQIKQTPNAKFSFLINTMKALDYLHQQKNNLENKQTINNEVSNLKKENIIKNNETKTNISNNHVSIKNNTSLSASTQIKNNVFVTNDITDRYLNKSHQVTTNRWKDLKLEQEKNNKKEQVIIKTNKTTSTIKEKTCNEVIKTIKDYDTTFKQDFFSIACNEDKELKKEFNEQLNQLKDVSSLYEFPITLFFDANKFLLVSNNGAVLLFDHKAQAMRFNQYINDPKIKSFINEKFHDEKLIIGIDKKQVLIYKDEFKNINKKDFKDVKIIKNKEITKTKLLEILNDDGKD